MTCSNKAPLEGLIVLDLTRVLSGSYATMLLGDLGATVIKIEDPRSGDTTRHSAPFKGGQSHYVLTVNRNKLSVALDLTKPEGREVLLRLCGQADVLIENFRPGTMRRLDLDYPTLQQANPALIICSITGFGQIRADLTCGSSQWIRDRGKGALDVAWGWSREARALSHARSVLVEYISAQS